MEYVWIITQHEQFDYCGIGGVWFETEAHANEEKAQARFNKLSDELGKYSGLYYSIEKVFVDK